MNCQKCQQDRGDNIEISQDVPWFLFEGRDKKHCIAQADRYGRHLLCKRHYLNYQNQVRDFIVRDLPPRTKNLMKQKAMWFAKDYFKKRRKD